MIAFPRSPHRAGAVYGRRVAIVDRAAGKLRPAGSDDLGDPTLVRPLLHRYDIGIV